MLYCAVFSIVYCILQGCHLMTEFVNRVKTEEARQALVQTVAYHRSLVTGTTKKDLEKL